MLLLTGHQPGSWVVPTAGWTKQQRKQFLSLLGIEGWFAPLQFCPTSLATRSTAWFLLLGSPCPVLKPLREQLTVTDRHKIPRILWNHRFITAHHLSLWVRWIQSTTSLLFTILILSSIYAWVLQLVSSFQVSPRKPCFSAILATHPDHLNLLHALCKQYMLTYYESNTLYATIQVPEQVVTYINCYFNSI